MHPMETWTHLEGSMKIKWWMLSNASSSHAMWQNLSASSSIEQTQFNNKYWQTNVQSELLIKDEEMHPTVTPKFFYKLTCSLMKKLVGGVRPPLPPRHDTTAP